MPSPLSYRPHYHRDWISSSTVRRMSYAARGIYHDLLDIQWEEGHIDSLPADIQDVLRCSDAEWAEFAPYLDKCFPLTDDGRQNPRCAQERSKATAKVEKNIAAGRAGGEAKARNHSSERLANATPNASTPISSERLAIPDTDTDKPPTAIAVTPKGVRFKPPALGEVSEYMAELGLPTHFPQKFLDYYSAQGWKLSNGQKMVDWKATCRRWKTKESEHPPKAYSNGKLTNQEAFETALAAMDGL